jgi:hypothetical protein
MGRNLVVGANSFAVLSNRQIDRANKFVRTDHGVFPEQFDLDRQLAMLAIKSQENIWELAFVGANSFAALSNRQIDGANKFAPTNHVVSGHGLQPERGTSFWQGLPESRLHGWLRLTIHGTGYPRPGGYDELSLVHKKGLGV